MSAGKYDRPAEEDEATGAKAHTCAPACPPTRGPRQRQSSKVPRGGTEGIAASLMTISRKILAKCSDSSVNEAAGWRPAGGRSVLHSSCSQGWELFTYKGEYFLWGCFPPTTNPRACACLLINMYSTQQPESLYAPLGEPP